MISPIEKKKYPSASFGGALFTILDGSTDQKHFLPTARAVSEVLVMVANVILKHS